MKGFEHPSVLRHENVDHPSHYTDYPVEVIGMIRAVLGDGGFVCYCLGNEIKYRMRAGLKGDNAAEDIAKAMKYREFRRDVEDFKKMREGEEEA